MREKTVQRETIMQRKRRTALPHASGLSRPAPDDMPHVHQFLGNRALQRLAGSPALQCRLKTGSPDDVYEQEADRLADQVMRMPSPAIGKKPG